MDSNFVFFGGWPDFFCAATGFLWKKDGQHIEKTPWNNPWNKVRGVAGQRQRDLVAERCGGRGQRSGFHQRRGGWCQMLQSENWRNTNERKIELILYKFFFFISHFLKTYFWGFTMLFVFLSTFWEDCEAPTTRSRLPRPWRRSIDVPLGPLLNGAAMVRQMVSWMVLNGAEVS